MTRSVFRLNYGNNQGNTQVLRKHRFNWLVKVWNYLNKIVKDLFWTVKFVASQNKHIRILLLFSIGSCLTINSFLKLKRMWLGEKILSHLLLIRWQVVTWSEGKINCFSFSLRQLSLSGVTKTKTNKTSFLRLNQQMRQHTDLKEVLV